jgi:phosphoribosylformylglycinamidine cyclo-ligase
MYPDGEYDLAGFAVGVVEKSEILDGHSIGHGDVVLGLASSGPHSNGYSLIRRIVRDAGADLDSTFEDSTLGRTLMTPTAIYVKPLLALRKQVAIKGMAHITGGGITGNLPRILGDGLTARLKAGSWQRPPVFDWLQDTGQVADDEMHRVFNCGIGMCVVVAANQVDDALGALKAAGLAAWAIGSIGRAAPGEAPTVIG